MRFNKITLATGLVALASAVSAIDTIVVKDRHFYTSKGDEFFVRSTPRIRDYDGWRERKWHLQNMIC